MEDLGLDVALTALRKGSPWYVGAAAATMVAIRLLRHPVIQDGLPIGMQWKGLPMLVRRLLIALASGAASWLTTYAIGQPPSQALFAALPVALTAIVAHKTTKAIGHKQTKRALADIGCGYEPSAARAAIEPLLPIDRNRIDIHQRLHKQRNGDEHV